MENKKTQPLFSVSDFIALTNQTLEFAYPNVAIEGEVASFKVNQGKYVFSDIKDESGSINCFMTVWQLRIPIEDGMKVIISATPKLTQWGKFSLTIKSIRPSGEGNLKRSFDLLKAKLSEEGLFSPERKRRLPTVPHHIGVISSTQAAGYADFVKILNDRWGGLVVDVAHVQVQGTEAPDQIIKAIRFFNSQESLPEVLVIVRGGGSADDLSSFNDELLVREIASSRIPTLVGVGHEIDESLADLAADVRAATPSNAAHILVPDRNEIIRQVHGQLSSLLPRTEQAIALCQTEVRTGLNRALDLADRRIREQAHQLSQLQRVIQEFDPNKVLARGYALVRGGEAVGDSIEIEKKDILMTAEVRHVSKK